MSGFYRPKSARQQQLDQHAEERDKGRPLQEGKITRMTQQVKNPERMSVFLDEAFAFGIAQDLVIEYRLVKGKQLSVEQQREIIQADELIRAKKIALDYISYKARTEREVRRKLERYKFEEETIEAALERFRELRYLNDKEYAQSFARSRLQGKGYGPQRIKMDLYKRGVGRQDIDQAVNALDQDETKERAYALGRKRWARLAKETDPRKRRKKLYDFLLRRGYDMETVRQTLERVQEEE